jgi:hypothetical protein
MASDGGVRPPVVLSKADLLDKSARADATQAVAHLGDSGQNPGGRFRLPILERLRRLHIALMLRLKARPGPCLRNQPAGLPDQCQPPNLRVRHTNRRR